MLKLHKAQNVGKTIFFQYLTPINLIYLIITNKSGFYDKKSKLLQILESLLKFNVYEYARRISWGDLKVSTGIRKNAYEAAQLDLKFFNSKGFDNGFLSLKSINRKLILEKIFFQNRYNLHEFYGMASQFAEESESPYIKIYIDNIGIESILRNTEFSKKLVKVSQFNLRRLSFILGILIAPVYILNLIKENFYKDSICYKNAIICEVDQSDTYKMFSELFSDRKNVFFVAQKHYLQYLTESEIADGSIAIKGISLATAKKIKNVLREYLFFCICNIFSASNYGWLYFDFLKTIARGYLLTIDAKDSAYLTFEHLDSEKAVRNELLRLNNNKSIFVAKNNYITSRYFASEFKLNYDILCSPCYCQELVYKLQNAETKLVLQTGSYDSHAALVRDIDFENRIDRLKKFKGNSIAITICSNGIMDETIRGEIGLMRLAYRLVQESNVKVFIRQKPSPLPLKYRNFYNETSLYSNSIMLTGKEFLLSDFLGVTDLFLTSSSSSVTDLCPAGAEFFCIDFWRDRDQFLWQTIVDGIFLSEVDAFDVIMRWINDSSHENRISHSKKMQELRKVIAYQHHNFDDYKKNFLKLLGQHLPMYS